MPGAEFSPASVSTGTNEQDVAASHRDVLGFFASLQLLRSDGVSRFEPFDSSKSGHI
jgi:hypothetical protein